MEKELDGVAADACEGPQSRRAGQTPKEINVPQTASERSAGFCVVGIGASAGGLEALERFFEHMPADTGLAFVVIQHLSPDFKSLMNELLSRRTEIVIHRVENGMQVEPNAIYLIPPKKEMIISGSRLLLTDKDPSTGLSLPIDAFFRSLAQDQGERAIGIILSGTGSDGTRGVRAIHEAGGLVIVQSEETAKFDGMPRSALEAGVADLVLPPSAMPPALLNYVEQRLRGKDGTEIREKLTNETGMNAVYSLLRAECGIDFSHYKPNTVLRRIDRRLQLNRSLDLEEYVEQLRNDRRELDSLYKDLLIGVTRFFRDPELFQKLKDEIIPEVLTKVPPQDEIRAWVAGCATGEEAYSLAMLFHRALAAAKRPVNVKIFATDVHRASLEFASAGVYDDAALSEVSPEMLERYFNRQGARYQISQDLRKLIVFAPHNVIKDAPFTKLDLISCRNLLIYLQTHAQQKALSLFHFGLKTGGLLILGPSESPGEVADEFETVDGHWKIYRKRRDTRLSAEVRLPLLPAMPQQAAVGLRAKPAYPDVNLVKVYDELLAACVPPSLLVSAQRELIHTFGGAGKFLRVPDGRPSNDVLDLVDHDLRLVISGAIQRVAKELVPVTYGGITLRDGSAGQRLRLCVRPLTIRGTDETYFLISLEADARNVTAADSVDEVDMGLASHNRLREVEDELRYTKENLQATVEEMETTNEELQATNEELVASNEELQSTNEELHSVNEELYTVNSEYQRKIVELTEMTDDMDNLLRSTDVGTIFLDRDLLIRKFTPKIAHAFQLLPQDVGRRIDSFAHNILHDGLLDDVRRVLESEEPVERDVQDRFGDWFLLRILPYRSKTRVEGIVITLINITRIKRTEQELRQHAKVFMDGADPIVIEDLEGKIVSLNREAEHAYGWSREELLGRNMTVLVPPEHAHAATALREQCRADDSVRNVESVRFDRSGRIAPVLLTLSLIHDEQDQPVAIASIAKDISAQKQAEAEARDAALRREQFLAMLSHELRNPLGAILNATRLIDRSHEVGETLRDACGVIDRQSKQMARLLDDLLDVARVTQGKIHIRQEVVNLRALVDEAVYVMRPLIVSRRQMLTLDLPSAPVFVEGDPARLLQVLQNLLSNAAKYTPVGGQLHLSLHAVDGEALLTLRDNGEGIAADMQQKIFDIFVQGPRTLARFDSGMGIGLTLARTIVELHGGKITVRSDGPGTGSEFQVRIGLTDKRPAEAGPPPSPPSGQLKVVVIEDNADSRQLLERLLKLDGCEVVTAGDGIEGYQAIVQQQPDVALVDIGLPQMDGYEVAKKVRSELAGRPIRLIALTGYGRLEDRHAVMEAGFNEHLVKPVDPADLARALSKPQ